MHYVRFKTDFKILSDAFATTITLSNNFGELVCQFRSILLSKNDFVVSWVRMQTNMVAHSIAITSLLHFEVIYMDRIIFQIHRFLHKNLSHDKKILIEK
jgi:hypothetical protein